MSLISDFSLKEWTLENEIEKVNPMTETGSEMLINYLGMSKYLANTCRPTLSSSGWTGGIIQVLYDQKKFQKNYVSARNEFFFTEMNCL